VGLLEEILKYSNRHAESVIVILLGLIVVGSSGGGMWIHNLQEENRLTEREFQLKERDLKSQISELERELREQKIQMDEHGGNV
jgi:Tfp pilus assembly protein PilO